MTIGKGRSNPKRASFRRLKLAGTVLASAGEDKTIPYLIDQFKAAGLEPAGENGGWTQEVPMFHTQLKPPFNVSVSQGGATLPLKFRS